MIKKIISSKIAFKINLIMVILAVAESVITGTVVYVYSGNFLKENTYSQMKSIQNQVIRNLNSEFDILLHQLMYIEIEPEFISIVNNSSNPPSLAQYIDISNLFAEYKNRNPFLIDNIFFYRYDDKLFSEKMYAQTNANNDYYIRIAKKNSPSVAWMYPGYESTSSELATSDKCLSLTKEIYDRDNGCGVIVVNMKVSALNNILSDMSIDTNKYKMFLFDENDGLVASSGELDIESNAMLSKSTDISNGFVSDKDCFFSQLPLDFGNFRFCTAYSNKLLTNQVELILQCLVCSLLICFVSSMIISYFVSKNITSPLVKFAKSIKSVENKNDCDTKFDYSGNDEIGVVVNAYNSLLSRVKFLIDEVQSEREYKMVAELNSLMQQINAHFLYNTLDVIYWMVKNNDSEAASEMVVSLSEILRISVSNGNSIIQVRQEVRHLEKYMFIQKYRYEFEYQINIDDSILNYAVPKLILQPIVENSIIHGFEDIPYMGKITVNGFLENSRIVFEIIDNGCGFDAEVVMDNIQKNNSKVKKQVNYALTNMYARFMCIYGRNDCIRFIDTNGTGTKVVLSLPIINSDDDIDI